MNKLKKSIESIGLNFKNQILILIILDIALIGAGIVLYLFINNPIIIAFITFVIVLVNYLYLSRYKTIKKTNDKKVLFEFVSLLPFFKTFIENGYTIYQSLTELCLFTGGDLLTRLQQLINDIDEDKSITPFINFSKTFNYLQIEQLMICVYQMIDEGGNENHIYQFQIIFDKLRETTVKLSVENKNNSLANMSVFPLIGSAVLIVMITFGIISVIGASLNGI